jgi:phosphoribosylamine---glycine ligase
MKLLIIGNGGREHAIGLKLSQSPQKPTILFAPGNPGMENLGQCIPVPSDNLPALLALAQKEQVDFTIVGPEVPLVMGIVDLFEKHNLAIFGPNAAAARLEGSKAFSKMFMKKYNIPTAAFQNFTHLDAALTYIKEQGAPIVVKASGLAAGKGAIVCATLIEAENAVKDMLGNKKLME